LSHRQKPIHFTAKEHDITLQRLLAGPIIRRTEATRVCIWLATSSDARVTAHVMQRSGDVVGDGTSVTVRLGERLFVHLIYVTPKDLSFPTNQLLVYDVEIDSAGERQNLGDLGLCEREGGIVYPGYDLPAFYIQEALSELNILHGSCRLLQGKGEDAMHAADEVLRSTAGNVPARPSLLLLTGDQVYADEVAGPLMARVRELATEVIGEGDDTSVPGIGRLSELGIYKRTEIATDKAKLTSAHPENHLMSFGEWVAMYLLAWNERNWPQQLPPVEEAVPDDFGPRPAVLKLRTKYNSEARNLERARAAIPILRRVMANIPTYMIFDDHDVTDDWNLNLDWRNAVYGSPTGRRAVANALASFWAFQGWGNNPDEFSWDFREMISTHASAGEDDRSDAALWQFDRWSYNIPAEVPLIVLDTRTQRSFDNGDGAARLLGEKERKRIVKIARETAHAPGDPLIVVSAVPVFGLELQERRQKFLVGKLGPYEIDFEAWHSNLQGLVDFLNMLIEEIGLTTCLILSGDVHYGLNARARFCIRNKELTVIQFVSSSLKHSGAMSKSALNVLGRLVTKKHERVGWDRPPEVAHQNGIKERLIGKSTNTDAWNDNAPVFLGPRRAEALGIKQPPDYLECRIYIRPEGKGSMLVGENNIGLVTVGPRAIVHRLMALGPNGTTEHVARVAAEDGLAKLSPQEW
jgi:PhoD-like phosphatase